jgi:integrase
MMKSYKTGGPMKTKKVIEKMFPKDPGKTYADGMYARVSVNGKFYWAPVEVKRQNPVPLDNTTSYIYRKMVNGVRKVTPLGKDLGGAFVRYRNLESDTERIKLGKTSLHHDAADTDSTNAHRRTVVEAAETFIADNLDAEDKGKLSDSSVLAYNNAVIAFRNQVKVCYMDEITREVLLDHETYLHKSLEKRANGKKQTTIANRFRYLNIFLGRNGIKMVKDRRQIPNDPGLLRFDEAPKEPKRGRNGNAAPDMYSLDEINKLLAVATEDEKDLIQFFLRLGVRDEEAQYAEWSDIETRREGGELVHEFHVQEKPKYDWKPKDREDRLIPVENGLYKRLMERRAKRATVGDLIFPNSKGTPDAHLIRRLQAASERAGLTKRPTLHKFRRTFASLMIGGSDLQTVQELLGHSDIETTALYLAPDHAKARKAARTAFNGVGD